MQRTSMAKKLPQGLSPKLQVEALLFSSGRTMTEETLMQLTGLSSVAVRSGLAALQEEYAARESAIAIWNDPTGWKMMVRDAYVGVVKHIVADTELTRACMETLAVIAYKYPKAIQSEVIDVRGSGAYEHMAELETLGFIRREPQGRSYAVRLTEKFFTYFDVADGKDIRAVFKNVKIPTIDKAQQQTLGELPVVEVEPKPEPSGPLDGMEVVDVAPPEEKSDDTAEAAEDEAEADADAQTAEPEGETQDSTYLDDLDARIKRLSERNDETEQDPALKRRPLPGADDTLGTEDADEKNADKPSDA
jgi:segregation and condensation protein B